MNGNTMHSCGDATKKYRFFAASLTPYFYRNTQVLPQPGHE